MVNAAVSSSVPSFLFVQTNTNTNNAYTLSHPSFGKTANMLAGAFVQTPFVYHVHYCAAVVALDNSNANAAYNVAHVCSYLSGLKWRNAR